MPVSRRLPAPFLPFLLALTGCGESWTWDAGADGKDTAAPVVTHDVDRDGFTEAGWLGLTNIGDPAGAPASAHGALLAAGGQLRIGPVTVEAGSAWDISAVQAENVDCPTTRCGGESGTATDDRLLFSGGAVDVRLGGPASALAVELEGGGLSGLTRPT
ncbi:hypothetical protein LBMAG42_54880 [Deltaproteobacteria bacterium]|nr:hypothetical protein LBMAG42_54880 [Deltaproteobacteria bacterium]